MWTTAQANPFLICEPQENTDSFELEMDGNPVPAVAEDTGNGLVRIHFDLVGIAEGSHTVRLRAINIWGVSEWSVPFVFESILPSIPQTITISK